MSAPVEVIDTDGSAPAQPEEPVALFHDAPAADESIEAGHPSHPTPASLILPNHHRATAYNPYRKGRRSAPLSVLTPYNAANLASWINKQENPLRTRPPTFSVPDGLHLRLAAQIPQAVVDRSVYVTSLDPDARQAYIQDTRPTNSNDYHQNHHKRRRFDQGYDRASDAGRSAPPATAAALSIPITDVGVAKGIASHYNSRQEVGEQAREESPIYGLRVINNWIKSVLIQKYARGLNPTESSHRDPRRSFRQSGGRVLDLGAGKGGDLKKWRSHRVSSYVGVDLAEVSINQAQGRWQEMNKPFPAFFGALDCFENPLTDVVPSEWLDPPFDTVSMQFCLHYAFETKAKAAMALRNVSRHMRDRGTFIGTIPNAKKIMESLDGLEDPTATSFGNQIYQIEFQELPKDVGFGQKYTFFLQDAVENVPEFLVDWDTLVESVFWMAAKEHLFPIYRKEFLEVFADEHAKPEYSDLLRRMKVVNEEGEVCMTEEQLETFNVYLAFAFEKRL